MKAKDLLRPRFEVIEEYPKCEFKKGEVLIRIKNATNDIYDTDEFAFVGGMDIEEIQKFPKLFKPLNWWEKRTIEEMPTKLICRAIKDDTEVQIIVDWDMKLLIGWLDEKKYKCCSLTSFNPEYGYFPID